MKYYLIKLLLLFAQLKDIRAVAWDFGTCPTNDEKLSGNGVSATSTQDCYTQCRNYILSNEPNWDRPYMCCMFDSQIGKCYLDEDDPLTLAPGQTRYSGLEFMAHGSGGTFSDNTVSTVSTVSTLSPAQNGVGLTWSDFDVFRLSRKGTFVNRYYSSYSLSDFFQNSDPSCTFDQSTCSFYQTTSTTCDTLFTPLMPGTPCSELGCWVDPQTYEIAHYQLQDYEKITCVQCYTSCCATDVVSVKIGTELKIIDTGLGTISGSSPLSGQHSYGPGGYQQAYNIFLDIIGSSVASTYHNDIACSLKEVGCSSPLAVSNNEIRISKVGTEFFLEYDESVQAGFSYDFCLQCDLVSIGLQGNVRDTETAQVDNMNLILDPDLTVHCAGKLQPVNQTSWSSTTQIYLNYESTSSSSILTTINNQGWNQLFTNSDTSSLCPLVGDCDLFYNTGSGLTCEGNPITSTYAQKTGSSFNVEQTAQQSFKWCARCHIPGGHSADKVIGDIYVTPILSLPATSFPDITLTIDPTNSNQVKITSPTQPIIQNNCPSCPITRCSLHQTDGTSCLSALYTGAPVSIDTNGDVFVGVQNLAELDYEFCVQCEYETVVYWQVGASLQSDVIQTQVIQDPYVKVSVKFPQCNNATQILNTSLALCFNCNYSRPDLTNSNCIQDSCSTTQIFNNDGTCHNCTFSRPDQTKTSCITDQCTQSQIFDTVGSCLNCSFSRPNPTQTQCIQDNCSSSEILLKNGTCLMCPDKFKPDVNGTSCEPIPSNFSLNWPPQFREPLAFDQQEFSIENTKVQLELPEIMDDEANSLRSVQIISQTFGKIMSSNETTDFQVETDKYIEYDFYGQKITLNLPESKLQSFEGDHSFEIILTDSLLASKRYEFSINLKCFICNNQNQSQDQEQGKIEHNDYIDEERPTFFFGEDKRQYVEPFYLNRQNDYIRGGQYKKITVTNDQIQRQLMQVSQIEALNKLVQIAYQRGAFGFFFQEQSEGDILIGLYMTEGDMDGEYVSSGVGLGGIGSLADIRDQESFEQLYFKFPEEMTVELEKRKPISIEHTKFTQGGIITLDFSEDLYPIDHFFNQNSTLEDINKDIRRLIDIQYFSQVKAEQISKKDENLDEDDEDEQEDVQIPELKSYSINSFSQRHLDIQLNFTNPLYVSSQIRKDHISINFQTNKLFMAKKDNLTLPDGFKITGVPVPAQIPSQEELELVTTISNSAQNGLLFSFLIPFLFMLFSRVGMDRVWSLYYMLQIMSNLITFVPLLIPPNALLVVQTIKNVACFMFFRNPDVQRFVKRYIFRGKLQWLKSILMDQGADMTNQILFFTILIIVLIGSRIKYFQEYCEQEKKQMMWSGWLRGKITCYFPTTIFVCAQLNQIIGYDDKLEGVRIYEDPSLFRYIWSSQKLLVLVIIPIFSYIHLKRNSQNLTQQDFTQKYGTLYLNLNKSKHQALTYSCYFCIKRLIIGVSTVYLNSSIIANAYINIFATLAFIKYLSDSMPMEFSYLNSLELMSEVTMLFFNYFFFLFTDFVQSVEMRYQVGKAFIHFTIATIFFNISLICASLIKDNLYQYKVKRSKEAWKEFRKLKVKMATFIVYKGHGKAESLLGDDFVRDKYRQRKRILKKLSYKEMEDQIIKIFNQRKTSQSEQKGDIQNQKPFNALEEQKKEQTIISEVQHKTPRFGNIDVNNVSLEMPSSPKSKQDSHRFQKSPSVVSESSVPSDFTIDKDFVKDQIKMVATETDRRKNSIVMPPKSDQDGYINYCRQQTELLQDKQRKMIELIDKQKTALNYQNQRGRALNNEPNQQSIKIQKLSIDKRFVKATKQ